MKPSQVKKNLEKHLLGTVYSRMKIADPTTKYKVGDYAGISKLRRVFAKKYMPNCSTQLFRIGKIQLTQPMTYLLQEKNNKNILARCYIQQRQKVKYPDVFLVEKVLKRQGNKMIVKWLGFNNKHNSWIKKNNIV